MVEVYWNSLVSETVRPPEVAEKATETSSAPQWPYFQQHLTEDVTGARSDYFQKHSQVTAASTEPLLVAETARVYRFAADGAKQIFCTNRADFTASPCSVETDELLPIN